MAEQQDITAAQQTYGGFVSLFKWGAIAAIAATALVILIISR